jgi:hypothetical protein
VDSTGYPRLGHVLVPGEHRRARAWHNHNPCLWTGVLERRRTTLLTLVRRTWHVAPATPSVANPDDIAGIEGNATISEWIHPHGPPSLFFVSQGSLYQITNHTHILYADLVNATHDLALRERSSQPSTRTAFKLRLSKKKSGLSVGTWDWYTTMLQFKLGHRSNHGLFYKCTEETGEKSIYVPLDLYVDSLFKLLQRTHSVSVIHSGRTPDGCEILTLTSYTVRSKDE